MKSEELKTTKELDLVIRQINEENSYFGDLCAHAYSYFASGSNDRSFHANIRNVIKERCYALGMNEKRANKLTNSLMTGARQYIQHVKKELGLTKLYSYIPKDNFLNQDKQPF